MDSPCDKHVISLLTGTLPQSEPHRRPPAQPCWPVCRGPRTHQANTWPARARAWSCASVSGSRHPAQCPLCRPSPLRLSPSSAHSEPTGLSFCSCTHQACPPSGLCRAVPVQGGNALHTPALSETLCVPVGLCPCCAASLECLPHNGTHSLCLASSHWAWPPSQQPSLTTASTVAPAPASPVTLPEAMSVSLTIVACISRQYDKMEANSPEWDPSSGPDSLCDLWHVLSLYGSGMFNVSDQGAGLGTSRGPVLLDYLR